MSSRLTVRQTRGGWALYRAGELVATADCAPNLLTLARWLGLIGRG